MRKSTAIKKQLEESKELAKAEGLMDDEKEFIENEIKDLEEELKNALDSESKQKTSKPPRKKGSGRPKGSKNKKNLEQKSKTDEKKEGLKTEKRYIIVEEEKIYQDDPRFCSKLSERWEKRKIAIDKAGGKKKTKSVMRIVASDAASTVVKGIKSISHQDLEKNAKKEIDKMKRIEAAAKEYVEAFKDIVGERLTQKEVKEEFEGVDKIIKQIIEKYSKK